MNGKADGRGGCPIGDRNSRILRMFRFVCENHSAVDSKERMKRSIPERLIELSGVSPLGLKELCFCYEQD